MLIWKSPGYIGEFEIIDDYWSGKIVIQLNGRLNKCGVISLASTSNTAKLNPGSTCFFLLEGLASSSLYALIVLLYPNAKTLVDNIIRFLDHEEARRKNVGGKLLGYVYSCYVMSYPTRPFQTEDPFKFVVSGTD
jgi:small subunit ribosomal protein S15Ae